MPPRRAHTKSRNGCDQCKKRRVKVRYIMIVIAIQASRADEV